MQLSQLWVRPTSDKLIKRLKTLVPEKYRLSSITVFIGITLLMFGGGNYYRIRKLSFTSVPPRALASNQNIDMPVEIIIPSVNISLKVDPAKINDGVWQISAFNATYLDSSTPPGNSGNTVIYGHNKKSIFGNLPYLSVGQKIIVKTNSGKIYNYIATEKYFVSPDRVEFVSPTDTEVLTLYTCWGIIDNQRAIIKAKPVN